VQQHVWLIEHAPLGSCCRGQQHDAAVQPCRCADAMCAALRIIAYSSKAVCSQHYIVLIRQQAASKRSIKQQRMSTIAPKQFASVAC
jgi:hypothetical protein